MGSYQLFLNRFKAEKLISRMINSALYFIRCAFILKENYYRLVAIQDKDKVIDMNYKTLKGAKIACVKILRKQTNNKGIKPVWSFLYPPDEKWLKDKLSRKKSLPKEKEQYTTALLPGAHETFGLEGLEPAVTL